MDTHDLHWECMTLNFPERITATSTEQRLLWCCYQNSKDSVLWRTGFYPGRKVGQFTHLCCDEQNRTMLLNRWPLFATRCQWFQGPFDIEFSVRVMKVAKKKVVRDMRKREELSLAGDLVLLGDNVANNCKSLTTELLTTPLPDTWQYLCRFLDTRIIFFNKCRGNESLWNEAWNIPRASWLYGLQHGVWSMYTLFNTPHLPGCFCPWTFFENIGFNTMPTDPFMSHLATLLGYSAGEFQALQLIVLATFGVVD